MRSNEQITVKIQRVERHKTVDTEFEYDECSQTKLPQELKKATDRRGVNEFCPVDHEIRSSGNQF